MIDIKILRRTVILGVIVELGLAAGGYFWPRSRPGLLFVCMLVAAVAGMLYARDLAKGFGAGALGGALTGAACGIAAVAAASYLDERPEVYIPYGVLVMMLTGGVGGIFGELDVRWRAFLARKLSN